MKLVCWHTLLTDHQAYTYGAVASRVEGLRINVWRTEDAVRLKHGWIRRSEAAGEEHTVPVSGWIRWSRKVLEEERDAVHLFGSPFENPRQIFVMLMAFFSGSKVGIISEPYSTDSTAYFSKKKTIRDRLKPFIRPLLYSTFGAIFSHKIYIVFAISKLACVQYARIGVPVTRIAPFGYFVPGPSQMLASKSVSHGLKLVYVGSLIERKGLSTAIKALAIARSAGYSVTLDLFGPGDASEWLDDGVVKYGGIIPFGEVGQTIRDYHALVLPSRFDGWGVVANEAIQVGVPVLVSDMTGAADVVIRHSCGQSFRTGDAHDLAKCLRFWLDSPSSYVAATEAAGRTAPFLDPVVAGDYLVHSLESLARGAPLPRCPWYSLPEVILHAK